MSTDGKHFTGKFKLTAHRQSTTGRYRESSQELSYEDLLIVLGTEVFSSAGVVMRIGENTLHYDHKNQTCAGDYVDCRTILEWEELRI